MYNLSKQRGLARISVNQQSQLLKRGRERGYNLEELKKSQAAISQKCPIKVWKYFKYLH